MQNPIISPIVSFEIQKVAAITNVMVVSRRAVKVLLSEIVNHGVKFDDVDADVVVAEGFGCYADAETADKACLLAFLGNMLS